MAKVLVTLLAGIVSLLFIQPAVAMQMQICRDHEAEAFGMVKSLPDMLSRGSLLKDMTVADALTVRVSDGEAEAAYGPWTSETGVLTIPKEFPNANCHLVLFAFLSIRPGAPASWSELAIALGRCLTSGGDEYSCIAKLTEEFGPSFERYISAQEPEVSRLGDVYVSEAYDFLIFHEYAHLVLKHFERASGDDPQIEFEADNYALRALAIANGQLEGAALNFFLLGQIDPKRLPRENSHDNYLCRLESTLNITRMMAGFPDDLLAMPGTPSLTANPNAKAIIQLRTDSIAQVVNNGFPAEFTPEFTGTCPLRSIPDFDAVRSDLLDLARFQSRHLPALPAANDIAGMNRLIRELTQLSMRTITGRAIRANLLVEYFELFSGEDGAEVRFDMPPMPSGDFRAGDGGRYVAIYALRQLYRTDGVRNNPAELDEILVNLRRALRMRLYRAADAAGWVRVYLQQRDCGNARDALKDFFGPVFEGKFPPALRARLASEVEQACG